MPSNARIGVVVLNWNGTDDTIACVESLLQCQPKPDRVVVVDNGSRTSTLENLLKWADQRALSPEIYVNADSNPPPAGSSWLTFLMASRNLGFAGGNNIGLRYLEACGEISHFLLLNNDATVAIDSFARMHDALESRPAAGLLTGTIYEDPDRDTVWYAGGHEIPWRALVVHEHDVPTGPAVRPTEFISGCLMLIARRVTVRLGLLPDCYFPLYHEDAEYSTRARKAGFEVLYAPEVKAYHRVGGAVGAAEDSPLITRAQIRNRILYVRRNFRGLERAVALGYLLLTKPGRILVEAMKGRLAIAGALYQGTVEGFTARTT